MSYGLRFPFTESRKTFIIFFAFFLISACSLPSVNAQKNNMTDKEDLNIREAQEMDVRMEIYVKIIDRRFLALTDLNAAKSKQAEKDFNNWGDLRTGTHLELFSDIQKTLEEAIGKIDDVADHDQKNPLFAKGVRILAKACERFTPQFKSFQSSAADAQERKYIDDSIEDCSLVINSVSKLPKEEPKSKDDKKKKSE